MKIWQVLLANFIISISIFSCHGQEPTPALLPFDFNDLFQIIPNEATLSDYKNSYESYKDWSENFDEPDFYDKFKLKDKLTNEQKSISDLPQQDKDIFFLLQADVISSHLTQLKHHWNKEFANRAMVKESPSGKEIAIYIDKLQIIRKEHAVRYEAKMKDVFDRHKDSLTEEEVEHYKKKVKDWHNKEKLINRE